MTRFLTLASALLICFVPLARSASLPPIEQLLPAETVVLIAAPDFGSAKKVLNRTTLAMVWNDPDLKPFRDKFLQGLDQDLVKPLQRELNLDLQSCADLLGGQVGFALVREAHAAQPAQTLQPVFLADTADKSGQLRTNLASLRTLWTASGRKVRSEKIRNFDFLVAKISTNELPSSVRRLFPRTLDFQELGAERPAGTGNEDAEVFIGQAGSLLIVTTSARVVERLLIRLEGGAMPALSELAAYQSSATSTLRNAPLYAWMNAKSFSDALIQSYPTPASQAPSPVDIIRPATLLRATGLADATSIALACRQIPEGTSLQLTLNVPETNRKGFFKILTSQPRDTAPPPFVPAEVTKYRRWRLDGKQTWGTLQTMMGEISPQWTSAMDLILTTANDAAKLKDPGFDIKSNLFGNLGDDWIYYEKSARGTTPAQVSSPPALWLIGSPKPDYLAAALKSVLVFLSPETPAEREFLGRKVYSLPLPYLPSPLTDTTAPSTPLTLSYAATSAYVALSTDVSLLEEFLRSPENQAKPLRDLPGLADTAQKILTPNTVMFGFDNQLETIRHEFQAWQSNPAAITNAPLPFRTLAGIFGVAHPQQNLSQFMDFSLLPPFARIADHFHFTVQSASVSVDAITFNLFFPFPPGTVTLAADRP
ncbi:MAG TPA: hypothetical protein VN673_01460 [Clostridia bacterium]|nr:hypothetical protein [Clostridia bacterium]